MLLNFVKTEAISQVTSVARVQAPGGWTLSVLPFSWISKIPRNSNTMRQIAPKRKGTERRGHQNKTRHTQANGWQKNLQPLPQNPPTPMTALAPAKNKTRQSPTNRKKAFQQTNTALKLSIEQVRCIDKSKRCSKPVRTVRLSCSRGTTHRTQKYCAKKPTNVVFFRFKTYFETSTKLRKHQNCIEAEFRKQTFAMSAQDQATK